MNDEHRNLIEQASQVSLDSLFEYLTTEEPLPTHYLVRLSGLEGKELERFAGIYPSLSELRRLSFMEDLEDLAASNSLVDFETVSKLGLQDPSAAIRVIAIRSLWESDDSSLIPEFIHILNLETEEIEVRTQAADGLGNFIYLGELEELPQNFLKLIVSQLLAVMENKNGSSQLRRKALESLGYSSHASVPALIEEACELGNDDWVESALIAMGRSANNDWESLVLDKLDHSNNEIRLAAVRAAGELAIEDAASPIIDLLADEEDEIRQASIWAISEIGGNEVRDALEYLLENTTNITEIALIEEALENLALQEDSIDFNFLDFTDPSEFDEID